MADVIVAKALVAFADVLMSIAESVEPLPLVTDPLVAPSTFTLIAAIVLPVSLNFVAVVPAVATMPVPSEACSPTLLSPSFMLESKAA